jgi:hypothetical protein
MPPPHTADSTFRADANRSASALFMRWPAQRCRTWTRDIRQDRARPAAESCVDAATLVRALVCPCDPPSGMVRGSVASPAPRRRRSRDLRFACLAAAARSNRPRVCGSIAVDNGPRSLRVAIPLGGRRCPQRPRNRLDDPLLACPLLGLRTVLASTSARRQTRTTRGSCGRCTRWRRRHR